MSAQQHPAIPGQRLTRWAVTAITLAIVALCFAFSLGNVRDLALSLGVAGWISWLIGPAVDLSVIGLLVGIRFLSINGWDESALARPRRLLTFCGLLTLALNTAGSLAHHRIGTALVESVGPALLICWSDVGPWLLRQVHGIRPQDRHGPDSAQQPADQPPPGRDTAPEQPHDRRSVSGDLLPRARQLDAEHRRRTGRPISRDRLRAQLHIGRDKASALTAAIRAEAAEHATAPDTAATAADAPHLHVAA